MRKFIFYVLLLAGVLGIAAGLSWLLEIQQRPSPQSHLQTVPLVIRTAQGKSYPFKVEVAKTHEEQEKGLMFRTALAEKKGMLFVNDAPRQISMWMKNTLIPLDIIFIAPESGTGRPGGRIACITHYAAPQSTELISCAEPVISVLEINAGLADRFGMAVGDTVLLPYALSNP